MTSLEKRPVLGIQIAVTDYDRATERIISSAQARTPLGVTALAVHGVMTGVLDPTQRFRLNSLDMCVPDGQPVRWALNRLRGCKLSDRVYGPELMLRICARAEKEKLPIYLYGSTREVLAKLGDNLRARYPSLQIAGTSPSRFRKISSQEKVEVVREIRDSGAAIVFCGLGCPRQEVWTYEYRDAVGFPIVAVGAAFEFFAGTARQAPPLLQRYGMEWAFRLWSEPRRLWKRYLLLNPLYIALLVAEVLRLRQFSDASAITPSGEIGFG